MHLETALRGVIIGERWPKSGVEVVITILEGDEDGWWGDAVTGKGEGSGWGLLNVLAGCITVAGAALADAGIDCVDLVSGGVAAIVQNPDSKARRERDVIKVLDPSPSEHQDIIAACAVGYLAGRDEITEIWMKGDVGDNPDELIEGAAHAAMGSLSVLKEVVLEAVAAKFQLPNQDEGHKKAPQQDIEMSG